MSTELPTPSIRIDAFGDILPTDGRRFVMGDFYSADQMRAALASPSAAPAGEPPKPVAWMRTQRTNSADWDYIDFSANPEPGFDVPLYAAASPLPAEPAGVQGVHQTERLAADGAAVDGMRWIPVSERLPARFTEVLIAFAGCTLPATGQYTANVNDTDGWCYPAENRGDGFDWTVTHWMVLPDVPSIHAAEPDVQNGGSGVGREGEKPQ